MKTAHQNASPSQAKEKPASTNTCGCQVLFQWNHTDATQFKLVSDPGWSVHHVKADEYRGEHLAVLSPESKPGKAYLMVAGGVDAADYEMRIVHGFFNTGRPQLVYSVMRGVSVSDDVYVASRWEIPHGRSGRLTAVFNEGEGDEVSAAPVEDGPLPGYDPWDLIVETRSSVRGQMVGQGWGRISSFGHIETDTYPALRSSRNVGMMFDLPQAGPGVVIKIYDMVVVRKGM